MLVPALWVALIMFIGNFSDCGMSDPMIRRPIVMSMLVGLALGDLRTGIIMGASLEVIFLGISGIGGAMPSDSMTGSIFGTAFAILNHQGVEVALSLAVPISLLAVFINQLVIFIRGLLLTFFEKYAEEDKTKSIERLQYLSIIGGPLVYALIGFLGIYLGSGSISTLVHSIPQVIMNGLTVLGQMLPALGIALLLNMIYEKGNMIYLLLGFLLSCYLKLPIIAVALIGIILAIILSSIDKNILDVKNMKISKHATLTKQSNDENSIEEDFFND